MHNFLKNGSCKLFALNIMLMLSKIKMLDGLKCVCNPSDCDLIRQNDCPGKMIVLDACKCCKVCAKVEGEPCGGAGGFHGSCEPPLKCISRPPVIGTGICLDLPPTSDFQHDFLRDKNKNRKCQDSILIRPGCEIVDRTCQCWHKPTFLCKDNIENINRWDFANVEECELNLANIIESESEFDEDFTVPPKSYDFIQILDKRKKLPAYKKRFNRKKLYHR